MMDWLSFTGADGYWLTRFCLQRALGAVYLIAFLVAANQFRLLCGERGLLPAKQFIRRVPFRRAPSIFHFWCSDRAMALAAWAGVALSVLAVTGVSDSHGLLVSITVWALLWALYQSFVNVGQVFYGFGWESILLETGFLAIFLGPSGLDPPVALIWLLAWVLFRVMYGAGLIKLRGDPCWWDLTCLHYHFETQPMPNPLSWYFHRLPGRVKKAGVAFNHVAELPAPVLLFLPPPMCWLGAGVIALFQIVLIASGNLSWLNWLTLVLCIPVFSDAALGVVVPVEAPVTLSRPLAYELLIWAVVVLVAVLSVQPIRNMLSRFQVMNAAFDPLHLVNTYGAFGSVTRKRHEVILEGTDEPVPTPATEWRAYELKGKPGDPYRMPPQVAPYHLRLDWQMWFAAMAPTARDPWLLHLVAKLLQNDRRALKLIRHNPFAEQPPRWVRATLYQYWFTDPEQKRSTGCWWVRRRIGEYLQPVSLDHPGFRDVLERQGWIDERGDVV